VEEDAEHGEGQEVEDDTQVEHVDDDAGANVHNRVPEADHVEDGAENDGGAEQVNG
jgi:hypothetical protein